MRTDKLISVRPRDIIGSKEAAEILDVERTRIARYRRTGAIPEPWSEEVSATPLWLRKDITKVAAKRKRAEAVAERKAKEREEAKAAREAARAEKRKRADATR